MAVQLKEGGGDVAGNRGRNAIATETSFFSGLLGGRGVY